MRIEGFDDATTERGVGVYRNEQVLRFDYDPNDASLYAEVQGTRKHPYIVIAILGTDGEIEDSECSCPVGYQCKHVVAALLAYRVSRRANADNTRGEDRDGSTSAAAISKAFSPPATQRTQLSQWLQRMDMATRGPSPETLPSAGAYGTHNPRYRIYALDGLSEKGSPVSSITAGVHLSILEATRSRAGKFAKGRRFVPHESYRSYDTRTDTRDVEIVSYGAALASQSNVHWYSDKGQYALSGRLGAMMLESAVETARSFVGTERKEPIAPGPSRELQLAWTADERGAHTLNVQIDGLERGWIVPTDPPMYVDPEANRAGRLLSELSGAQIMVALDAPVVAPEELYPFCEALEDMQAHRPLSDSESSSADELPPPLPLPIRLEEDRIDVEPVPQLLLHSIDQNPHVDTWTVSLLIRYDEAVFACDPVLDQPVTRTELADGRVVRVQRDGAVELGRYLEFLRRFPQFSAQTRSADDPEANVGIAQYRFVANGRSPADRFSAYREIVAAREALEAGGWELTVLPPVHTEVIRPTSFTGLIERDARDPGWFDVSLGFEYAGVRHELMPLVVSWLERGRGDEPVLAEQPDGRFVEVPAAALKPVADVFDELGEQRGGRDTIRLSKGRALALDSLGRVLEETGIDTAWDGDQTPLDFARRLRSLSDVDTADFENTPVPRALRATLRPYQRAGLGWLNTLARHDLCGVLADDMGLGKTVQTLAHVLWLRSARRLDGPVLVVAPTSLLGNWAREAAQFAPRLKVRVWHGGERHDQPLMDQSTTADMVITSYGLVLRDREVLADCGFAFLVLDEAQQIRNPTAKITRAVKSLPIERRLCLSGTPLENHLGELWSQFDFLMPGLLGDRTRFTRHYRTPIERHGNDERRERLAEAIRPFLLRRRKEAVAADLPAKTEIVREITLGDAQSKLYESIRVAMQERVRKTLSQRGVAQSQITVLDSLLKLRQLCCHPELVKLPSARRVPESAKTSAVLDMLDEMISEGRRVLVFSQFTSMLTILERELAERNVSWVKLTGQTRRRDEAIDRFQRGEVPLFLISLKAGGTGLNLTAADTVIHYDPWWNPAAEDQASARAHRIGQDKPVFIYRLVSSGTVEERIVALQERKRQLADGVLEHGEAGALSSMSAEETLSLFDAL